MKRNIFLAIFLMVAVMFCGCGSNSKIVLGEMYAVPQFNKAESIKAVYKIEVPLPKKLNIADTALLNDEGIEQVSIAWMTPVYYKDGEDWKFYEFFGVKTLGNKLTVLIPVSVKFDFDNTFIGIADHAGKRIFDPRSEKYIKLGDIGKFNPEKAENFLPRVSEVNPMLYENGTEAFERAVDLNASFVGQKLQKEVRAIYKEYNIPFYSALPEEVLKKLEKSGRDKLVKQFFGEGWYVVATYPILTPQAYGAYILASKVFQIPKQLFQEDLNQPGYMDRVLTAGDYYELLEYYEKNYKPVASSSIATKNFRNSERLLPENVKLSIQGTPCEKANTYEEYNNCVLVYNSKIIKK